MDSPRSSPRAPILPGELAAMGLAHVAYLRAIEIDGQPGFAIHAADGRRIGIAPSRDTAWVAARHHDLELVGLH